MKITPADLRFLEYRLSARWRRFLPRTSPLQAMLDPRALAVRALMEAINARGELPGRGVAGNAVQLLRMARRNLAHDGVTTAAGYWVVSLEQYMQALCRDTGDRRTRYYRRWLRKMALSRRRGSP